jgi:hypothetical protein
VKLLPLLRRRAASESDARILQRLRSADRKVVFGALQGVFQEGVVSASVAAELPRAAARLFYETSPGNPQVSELEDYRALVADTRGRVEKSQRKDGQAR